MERTQTSILVTAIGSFSAGVVIPNLQAAGMRVVGCDIYPAEWLATSADVDVFYQAPLARDAAAYMDFICSTIKNEGVSYVMPLTDIEVDVLDVHRDAIEACGAVLCISSHDTIRICRDKRTFSEFVLAHELPVNVIPTRSLADVEEPQEYPVVAKPINGRSSEGLFIVHDTHDWQQLKAHADGQNYIVQPFIKGNIFTIDVVRDQDTGTCVAIPREELLRTLNGAGTSVRVFADEGLSAACTALADALNICGCVNFEFICDENGAYWLVECNPRFSGGVKFSCMTGYDCILNHLRCFTGEKIDDLKPYESCFIARKYKEFVTATLR